METRNALAVRGENRLPVPATWQEMREQADVLVKSGFLPTSIKTAEAAIAIMMTGADFGFTPMQSFRLINVIEGKPCLSADAMAAVVGQWCRNVGGDAYLKVVDTTNQRCVVRYKRPEAQAQEFTFTIEDAKQAELLGKANWKKYPAAMLRARAIAGAARMGFPDVVAGVYDPEEFGYDLGQFIDGEGEVRSVNTVTGEIIEPEAIEANVPEPVDKELSQAKRALWDLANGKYGWSRDALSDVGEFILGAEVAEMSPAGLHDLKVRISGLKPDVIRSIADGTPVASVLLAEQVETLV